MRKEKDYKLVVQFIISSIYKIEKIADCSYEEFIENIEKYASIIYFLEKITDATKRIPAQIKAQYPQIDWINIIGFRNILVHDYLGGYDNHIIWNTVHHEIPKLKNALIEIEAKLP